MEQNPLMTAPARKHPSRILLSVPHMGGAEMSYVQEAFATNWLSTVGPNLDALEKEFSRLIGLPSVALGSGTAGIHLGIKLLGFKPGDEMVTPTLTFAASCNPLLYERAMPVFLDSDRASWNLDPNLLADFLKKRAAANKLPKAVTVVHLFGQSADLDAILECCRRYELPLLEDAAESLGAKYQGKLVGAFGDVGVFSFNGNKIITCTGGGMLVSPRSEWVDKARYWSTQARDPDPQFKNYLHSEAGYNYRLSNVLAGIARGQLEVLEQRVAQRRAIAFRYRDALADVPGIELMPQAAYGLHINWLSCFLIDERLFGLSREELIRFLDAANVESRPVWKPMHTQKLYQGYECVGGAVAEDLNRRGICLPSSSSLTREEQQFVIDRVREAHTLAGSRKRAAVAAK
jgi:pyridoxal phosphate-dependent aminotransferase EpsN